MRETKARKLSGLLLPAVVVMAAAAVLVSLGNWQMERLAWKEELIARVESRPSEPMQYLPPAAAWAELAIDELEYRPFRLEGRFLHEAEAHVFTVLSQSRDRYSGPGYWIMTPLVLNDGGTVLVNRGFAPHGLHAPADRGEALPEGTVEVVGLLRESQARTAMTPNDEPEKNVFYTRTVERIAEAKGLEGPVAPFTIDLLAEHTPPGGLPQAGETRVAFANPHLQYAITWYGIAAALLIVFAAWAWQRLRQGDLTRVERGGAER